jgi:ring-1,2-phenylacetyl-CoA epoxidase subunit PaaD
VVSGVANTAGDISRRAWQVAARVCDPELPGITIDELGVLREVAIVDGTVEVRITPTYSGCPAIETIGADIARALDHAGIAPARVRTVRQPAWTSDWMTPSARAKLAAMGIAPPPPCARAGTPPACPACGSADTGELARFGSTACKALWRCRRCGEPFDRFKCH